MIQYLGPRFQDWGPRRPHGQVLDLHSHSLELMSILKQSDAFTKEDIAKLASKLSGRKASIGVKKLLGLIDMVKQTDPR